MKKIICDICNKSINLKKEKLFFLEICEVTEGKESYPSDFTSVSNKQIELCSSCKTKLMRLNKLKCMIKKL